MPSMIPQAFWENLATGVIDLNGTFRAMLTTAAFTPNKDTLEFRSEVTNEVAAGAGYAAGGEVVDVTITRDDANDRIDIGLGGYVWTAPAEEVLTARQIVYYEVKGGAASADPVIAVVDWGTDKIASGGTLTANASTIRIDNSGA